MTVVFDRCNLYLKTRVKCRRSAAHALLAELNVSYILISRVGAFEYAEMFIKFQKNSILSMWISWL